MCNLIVKDKINLPQYGTIIRIHPYTTANSEPLCDHCTSWTGPSLPAKVLNNQFFLSGNFNVNNSWLGCWNVLQQIFEEKEFSAYEVVQVLHEHHRLSSSLTLFHHNNSGWFYLHLLAQQLEAQ